MPSVFNVLIIGAGKIGAFFDTPKQEAVLTHAHAFKNHPEFKLLGFVDVEYEQAIKAAKLWDCQAYLSIEEAFAKAGVIDVVVVSVPDCAHASILEALKQYPLKLVFLEKPIAGSLADANALIDICAEKDLPVLVNYSRRYVEEFQSLQKRIRSGALGSFITGSAYYGKGILHNGSHVIDLLRYLIGEVKDFQCVDVIRDYSENDPSVSAALQFEDSKIFFLHAIDSRLATVFEIDIFFENARIRIIDSGFQIEESEIGDNPLFTGYRIFRNARSYRTALDHALESAVNNIGNYLNGRESLKCDLNEGFKSAEICFRIAEADRRL